MDFKKLVLEALRGFPNFKGEKKENWHFRGFPIKLLKVNLRCILFWRGYLKV